MAQYQKVTLTVPQGYMKIVLRYQLRDEKKKGIAHTPPITSFQNAIFKAYEQNIGSLTPSIFQDIQRYLGNPNCPPQFILDAIGEAILHNQPRWRYVRGVLNHWIADGKQTKSV